MARRSRRSLEDFTKEIKLETFSEGIDLLDDTNLPPWQPLIDPKTKRPYTFHAFVDRFMPAIEPRWKGFDEAASFMASHMEDAVNGRDQRYAFIPPPRAGKSLLGVALWIFNLTVVDGSQPVLFISASTQLATSHARKALKLFQATGNMLSPKSASVTSWIPHWSGGAEQAARGATSKVQGLGFGLGILDDACGGRPATQSSAHMEQIWSAYTSDWTSRGQLGASGKGNNLVVIEQRLSNQDLMQRIIDHENLAAKRGGGTPYHVIHLPIEHPHDLGAAVDRHPDHFYVHQLDNAGREGEPLWSRIDRKAIESRRALMSPAAFEAFYLGCVDLDYQTSGFRETYLQQVPAEDLQPGSCVLALDIALTGQADGHGYCLACRGQYEQAGDILLLESGAWKGIAPEELVTPIGELCAKYPGKVGQIVVEKASGGVPLLNQLRSRMPAHIQIQPQSHGSKSKLQRYEVMALPHFASGRVKVPAGAAFILPLRDSFRKLLASSRGGLDQADACIYGIGAIGKQLEGGFAQTPVNWSGTGGTPVTWSRGATAIDPQNNPSTEFGTWTTTPIYRVW